MALGSAALSNPSMASLPDLGGGVEAQALSGWLILGVAFCAPQLGLAVLAPSLLSVIT